MTLTEQTESATPATQETTKKPLGLKRSAAKAAAPLAEEETKAVEAVKQVLLEGVEADDLTELGALYAAAKSAAGSGEEDESEDDEAEDAGDEARAILLTRATIHECDRLMRSEAECTKTPQFFFLYASALLDLVMMEISVNESEEEQRGFLEFAEEQVERGLALDSNFADLYPIAIEISLEQGFVEMNTLQDEKEKIKSCLEKTLAYLRKFVSATIEDKHDYFLEIGNTIAINLDDYAEYDDLVQMVCDEVSAIAKQIYDQPESQRNYAHFLLEFGSMLSQFAHEDEDEDSEEWEDEEDLDEEDLEEESLEGEEEEDAESDSESLKAAMAKERLMFSELSKKFLADSVPMLADAAEKETDVDSKGASLIMLCEAHVLLGNLDDSESGIEEHKKAIAAYEKCKEVCPDAISEDLEESIEELKACLPQ